MDIEVNAIGDKLVKVTITGRLDAQGVDRIETRLLASLVPNANNAIIDLSQVDYVASLAIRMFMSAAKSLRRKQAGWRCTARRRGSTRSSKPSRSSRLSPFVRPK